MLDMILESCHGSTTWCSQRCKKIVANSKLLFSDRIRVLASEMYLNENW